MVFTNVFIPQLSEFQYFGIYCLLCLVLATSECWGTYCQYQTRLNTYLLEILHQCCRIIDFE
jgi:hypothetical protein